MEGAPAPQSNAAQGEISSISGPIGTRPPTVILPTNGPEYKIYYVTEDQLRLIRDKATSHYLSLASLAVGIFFTALATFTQVDYSKQPRFFIVFVVLIVVSFFASLAWGIQWWRDRKQLYEVFEEFKSQHRTGS